MSKLSKSIALGLAFLAPAVALAQGISYTVDDAVEVSAPPSVIPCGELRAPAPPCHPPAPATISTFQERTNFTLPQDLVVDANTVQTYAEPGDLPPVPAKIRKGSCVNSFLLVFHPSADPGSGAATAAGTIRFDTPVIGFIMRSDNLYASDGLVGRTPPTSYPTQPMFNLSPSGISYGAARGFELKGQDIVGFTDPHTISIGMTASYPGDQLRVLTACCPCMPSPNAPPWN